MYKKKYLSPNISVAQIFMEESIASSSIAQVSPFNDSSEIEDIWLQDTEQEIIIDWTK